MANKARKYKHGQRIVKYTMTDFALHRDGIASDTYIHPTICISSGIVTDVLEDYRQYGGPSYLARAERLRAATGDTLHIEHSYCGSDDMTIRWQSDRQSADTPRGWSYQPFYGCRIDSMGLDATAAALLTKLLKAIKGIDAYECGNGIRPITVVAALQAMGAVNVEFSREADSWLVSRPAEFDGWFNLAPECRQGYVAPVETVDAA